ncbi:hypothetical protein ACKKBG_A02970 [Auxenochlorella protothecoides x Auxenochlorella symbiontica]
MDFLLSSGCSNLVTLALDSNGMTGSLPGSLTLTALKAATFVGNALTGSIPTWSKGLPSSASVAVLPQTGTTSLCGSVPASPGLTYSSSGTSFALANSLGSCFVPCSQTVTTSLTGTNLFDVAVAANVTAWDLARGNLLTLGQGTASSVTIPCYGTGSPVGSYLGGDAAYGALAWGSASGAASVTSHSTSSCLAASGTGSYVRVDLAASYALASVVLVLAGNGLAGGAVSVGVAADGSDATTCASGLVLGAGTVAVTCAASGRYVTVSGTTLGLCGVQVYPAVSDAALGKAATYTTASGTATLASFSTAAKLGIAGSSPSFVLDLGYTASLASVVVGSPTGLGVVSLQASNPLAGTSPSSRRLLRAAPSGVDAAGVAGAGGEAGMEQLGAETRVTTTASAVGRRLLASTACSAGSGAGAWTCAGLSGRYLVLAASDGTLSFTTLRAFASAAPALAVPPPPPPPGGGATLTSQLIFVGGTVATFRLTSTSDRTVFLAAINAAFQAAIEDAGYEMTTADTTLESATTSINPSEYGYTGSVPSGAQTLLLTVSYTTTLPATSVDSVLGTSSVASAISSSLDASGFGAPAVWLVSGSPAPPPPPAGPDAGGGGGLGTGALVGAVVGGVAGAAALLVLIYLCCCRRRRAPPAPAGAAAGKLSDWDEPGALKAGYAPPPGGGGGGPAGAAATAAAAALVTANGAHALARWTGSATGSGSSGGPRSSAGASSAARTADPLLEWITRSAAAAAAGTGPTASGGTGTPPSSAGGRSTPAAGAAPGTPAMDFNMWMLSWGDLDIQKQVGEGSFGRVYLAKWHETLVAVKVLMATGVDIDDVDEAARALTMSNPIMASLHKEAHMMASMRHPNVVGFLGLCTNPPCVASEYCARGSLTDVLRGAARSPARAAQLDWSRRLNMALDACKGMLYLHSHAPPIVHRDLKSPNLLVDRHWRVKISDFNLSKLLDGSPVMSSLAATNPRWLAPEILAGHAATFASDVYAFGIVLWEMLTWELPWPTSNPWQVVTVVTEGGRLAVPDRAALPGPDTQDWDGLDAYVDLIRACWAQNPNDRPTFSEVIPVLRDLLEALMHKNATQGRPSSTPVGPPTMAEPLYLKQAASLSRLGATRSNGGGAGDSVPGDPPAPGSTA